MDLANAAIQKAKSFVELIRQRSPGHRTQGQLVKTKHRIAKRHERALPKVQLAIPILPPVPSLFELVAPPIAPKFASVEAMTIPPLVEQTPLPPGFTPPPGLIVPPTETPPVTPPPPPPPPPPPVPEPSTWASMLLGFALMGWMLRAGRREDIALVR